MGSQTWTKNRGALGTRLPFAHNCMAMLVLYPVFTLIVYSPSCVWWFNCVHCLSVCCVRVSLCLSVLLNIVHFVMFTIHVIVARIVYCCFFSICMSRSTSMNIWCQCNWQWFTPSLRPHPLPVRYMYRCMVFKGCGFTSGGQKLGSALGTAANYRQGSTSCCVVVYLPSRSKILISWNLWSICRCMC